MTPHDSDTLKLEKATYEVDPKDVTKEMVSPYPAKVARKRAKHIVMRDPSIEGQEIQANVRTVPGILNTRHCAFAGCKGVVVGPFGDVLHIVHGPVGCSYYTWMTRRNQYRSREDGKNYMSYCVTTDMQDSDIVFGGVKKLRQAVQEGYDIFKPNAITITATCPVGLIGDDIQTVAKEMTEELGISVVAFNCEGYKGVSQSAGHHIANNGFFKNWVGEGEATDEEIEGFTVNLLGEYNIGGDSYEIERVLEKCGINVIATFSGDGTYDAATKAHLAQLNLVMCHRSINYMAEMMETKFGVPWTKVSFIGVQAFAKSLRKVARFFNDEALTQRIEEVIAEEVAAAEAEIAPIRERLQGKSAILFVGGSRAHHYQDLFADLGIKTIAAGYEFAHRDDYEGRQVLPLKVDADSRNVEELRVEKDPERYKLTADPAWVEQLKEEGFLNRYEGMISEMGEDTLMIDDISHHELETLIKRLKPDIVGSGIKDKYVIEKFGVPCKQLHNYDYGGPFAGFQGAVNFAKDIDMRINNPTWKLVKAPWQN
jgi:nitrogenase molybdenum-iron protein alpha chain